MTNDKFLTKNRKNKIFETKSKKTIEKMNKVLYNIDNEKYTIRVQQISSLKTKVYKKTWS